MYRNNRNKRTVWSRTVVTATVLGMVLTNPAGVLAADSHSPATLTAANGDTQPNGGAEAPAVKAEPKITKDEAVDILRKLFPDQLKNATVVNVQLGDHNSYPSMNPNVWDIQWEYRTGNSSFGFSSRVDSLTGDLIQHSFYMPFREENITYYPPKLSRQEAQAAAEAFLKKAAPSLQEAHLHLNDRMNGMPVQPLFGPVQYGFFYDIDVNGVKSPSNSLNITVDGNGSVVGFNRNTVQAEYPSPNPKVTKEEAVQAYEKNTEYSLQYIPVRTYNRTEPKWLMAWVEDGYATKDLDAHSGEFMDFNGSKAPEQAWKAVEKKSSVFSPSKGSDNGELTAEEAVKLAAGQLSIPTEYTLSGQYKRTDYTNPDQKMWQLMWRQPQKPGDPMMGAGLSVGIDAETGQILEYSSDLFIPPWMMGKKEPVANPISAEQAEAKALEWINLLYPQASEDLKMMPSGVPGKEVNNYSFSFRRYYNGIPVGSDTASISLDAAGKLVSFHANRSKNLDVKLKGLTATITKDQAAGLYKKERTVELQYRTYGGYSINGDTIPTAVKLVYTMAPADPDKLGYVVDASTGEWTPSFIEPASRSVQTGDLPADIRDHGAKAALSTLLEHGVIEPDGNGLVHPDATLTLGNWMTMVMRAVNPTYDSYGIYYDDSSKPIEFTDVKKTSPYYSASQFYLQYRLMNTSATPELHPEKALTREELAVQLIKLVRYEKLSAFMDPAYLKGIQDSDAISPSSRGAVALAIQLGLLTPGPDSRLDPQHVVTTAEAASVMIRLAELQGKLDQTLFNGY